MMTKSIGINFKRKDDYKDMCNKRKELRQLMNEFIIKQSVYKERELHIYYTILKTQKTPMNNS